MRKFAIVVDYEEPFRDQNEWSNDTILFTVPNNWSDATLQSIMIKCKAQAVQEKLRGEECVRRMVQLFVDKTGADWDFIHAKMWLTVPGEDLEEEEEE